MFCHDVIILCSDWSVIYYRTIEVWSIEALKTVCKVSWVCTSAELFIFLSSAMKSPLYNEKLVLAQPVMRHAINVLSVDISTTVFPTVATMLISLI